MADTSTQDRQDKRENVRRGAKLLDKLVPGWHNKMKPETLRMEDGALCAMGQLFGGKTELSIAKELYPELWKEHRHSCRAQGDASNGFALAFFGVNSHDEYMPEYGLVHKIFDRLKWRSQKEKMLAQEDLLFLRIACSGDPSLKCMWAEEVAERRVQEQEATNGEY